jgi:ATP-binding protein involved in chromosome partitioning
MTVGNGCSHGMAPDELDSQEISEPKENEGYNMKIAIPLADGRLCMHFGHCQQFALIETAEDNSIVSKTLLTPPPHEPGVLPAWLHEQGAAVIIAGGMGSRAQQLFAQNQITVVVGAPAEQPEQLVASYLNDTLQTGVNTCDH